MATPDHLPDDTSERALEDLIASGDRASLERLLLLHPEYQERLDLLTGFSDFRRAYLSGGDYRAEPLSADLRELIRRIREGDGGG